MTQPDDRPAFEAAYRRVFPIAASVRDLFKLDEFGYYEEIKVFTAYRMWRDARSTK
jgi:hypothetical protein